VGLDESGERRLGLRGRGVSVLPRRRQRLELRDLLLQRRQARAHLGPRPDGLQASRERGARGLRGVDRLARRQGLDLHAVLRASLGEVRAERLVALAQPGWRLVLDQELELARPGLGLLALLLQELPALGEPGLGLLGLGAAVVGDPGEVLGAQHLEQPFGVLEPDETIEGVVALLGVVQQQPADAALLQQDRAREGVLVEPEHRLELRGGLVALELFAADRDLEVRGGARDHAALPATASEHDLALEGLALERARVRNRSPPALGNASAGSSPKSVHCSACAAVDLPTPLGPWSSPGLPPNT
jgi:hypothetical protein